MINSHHTVDFSGGIESKNSMNMMVNFRMIKKLILTIVLIFISMKNVNANKMEYSCLVDYTNSIFVEQLHYAQLKDHIIPFDFNELGIMISNGQNIASEDGNYIYPDRVFYPTEPLVRDYTIVIYDDVITLKSNNKILLKSDLNEIGGGTLVRSELQSYTPSYLLVDFHFYNPKTMKNPMKLQVNFDDRELTEEFVSRSWSARRDYYLYCLNKIEKPTFIEYQKYWVDLYEKISKKKAKFDEY